ncbi:MAG: hypothetical protein JNJ73_16470 [Hyphomonadaceae bacterium]|nr:hypothetical protein [Hyphomonadaceae bacterium]
MTNIYFDQFLPDAERRGAIYGGDLFVYSANKGALKLVEHARDMIDAAFPNLDPEYAQFDMPVEEYAATLAKLKPAFIHHPTSKACIIEMLEQLGCDPDKTHFDVPRMRTSTSDNYLTTGIAYVFHPHRDTWYSAPPCQINWWLPIFPIQSDNGMSFHPHYFKNGVKNNSEVYDYYRWNQESRASAASHVKSDTRVQPKPQEQVELDPQIRIVAPPGAVTAFSAAQLHASVPNTSGRTRFSIDFRTVNVDDVASKRGAINVDSRCTGTALRDFLRMRDLARVPDELASLYDEGASDGVKIYEPSTER